MRKTMSKQVTRSTIRSAKMEVQDDIPVAISNPDIEILGNYSVSRAQSLVNKKYEGSIVLDVKVEKLVYEMNVEDFVQLATLKK